MYSEVFLQVKPFFPHCNQFKFEIVLIIDKFNILHFIVIPQKILKKFPAQCKDQPAITCSKLTIEALEQGVKYVQS